MKQNLKAVGVLFEDPQGEVLVLRRHSDSREGDTWGLVGGKIDDGETSQQAAIREVQEEISVRIHEEQLVFERSYVWEHDDAAISFDVYRYRIDKVALDIDLDTTESTGFLWETPAELLKRKDLMAGLYPILKDAYQL